MFYWKGLSVCVAVSNPLREYFELKELNFLPPYHLHREDVKSSFVSFWSKPITTIAAGDRARASAKSGTLHAKKNLDFVKCCWPGWVCADNNNDCTWWTSQPITHIWSKNVLWPSEGVSLLYKSHTKSFSSWALLMLQLLTTLARVNQSTKTNFQLFLEHPSLSPHTWLLSHTSPINPLHPSGGASHCLRAPATTEPITKIWLRLGLESVLPLTSSRKMLLTLRGDSVFLSDSLDLDCVFCPKRNF